MLGEQFRAFDPNQGNYVLVGEVTTLLAGLRAGPVFYHQSRHLSDRIKRLSIDWNMLGGMVGKTVEQGPTRWRRAWTCAAPSTRRTSITPGSCDTGVRVQHRLGPARDRGGRRIVAVLWAWTGRATAVARPGSAPMRGWVSTGVPARLSYSWPWSAGSTPTSWSSARRHGQAWACVFSAADTTQKLR